MKNKKGYIIFCLIVAITMFFIFINARKKLKEIEDSGVVLVSKFSNVERFPKSRDYYFEFYWGNDKRKCSVSEIPNGFYNNIGKFYKIKYLGKYPDLIIVEFDQEVTDTLEIIKAGFSKEDL